MNYKTLFLVLASFLALFIISCDKDDDPVVATGISLDVDSLELEVESSTALIATLEPEGAEGDISWSSSDASVAAVSNGIVTAIKEGTATIAASSGTFSASCEVTVVPKTIDPSDLPASLQGTNYYPIALDGTSYDAISDKVIQDFRPDEENKFFYIWPDGTSFTAGSPNGTNFYGLTEEWLSLVVGSLGWSGGGYFVGADFGDIDLTALQDSPDDYVFHVAMKSTQASSSYLLKFRNADTDVAVCIGSHDFVDGATFTPYADFTRDGEWHSIEIPVSHLNSLGLVYNSTFSDNNVLEILGGGVQGTTIDFDAMFFYKKAE